MVARLEIIGSLIRSGLLSPTDYRSLLFLYRLWTCHASIEALYSLNHPSAGVVMVLVVSDDAPLMDTIFALQTSVPVGVTLICLRKREAVLGYVPDQFAMEMSDLYWYLESAHPVYARQPIFASPPEPALSSRDTLQFKIEYILHYTRSHLILSGLWAGDYRQMTWRLEAQLVQLLRALAIVEHHGLLPGKSLTRVHIEPIQDAYLRGCLEKWLELKARTVKEKQTSRIAAFQFVWLFESIVRCIRNATTFEKRAFNAELG